MMGKAYLQAKLSQTLEAEAPVHQLGKASWQILLSQKLRKEFPSSQRNQIERDLVLLLSDPDSSPRMERVMRYLLIPSEQ